MALGALRKVPEDFVNRLSFHFDDEEDDEMIADASPCRSMRSSSLPTTSASPLPMPSFPTRNRSRVQAHSTLGDLDMPQPLFKDSYRHKSTDSIESVRSVNSSQSLVPSTSSESDSEVDFSEDVGLIETAQSAKFQVTDSLPTDTSFESYAEGDSTIEDPDDIIQSSIPASDPPQMQLCADPTFDAETTPVGRTTIMRSRFHRVHHSTTEIPTTSFATKRHSRPTSRSSYRDATTSDFRGHSRASHNTPFWLPSPKTRRTQSMFATPEQMLHELNSDVEATTTAIELNGVSTLESSQCPIPSFNVKQDPFPRISAKTLCRSLDSEFSNTYSEVLIIDCRFEYEFEGGHIDGAINVNSKQQLEQALFYHRPCDFKQRVLLVFHCEHSAYRSPMLASHLRHCDRDINASRYPNLFYPDVAVLDGGYSKFYATAAERCVPQNYIGMNHREHQRTCEREMSRFRTGMKSRKFTQMGMISAPDLTSFRFPSRSSSRGIVADKENATETVKSAGRSASTATLPHCSSLFNI